MRHGTLKAHSHEDKISSEASSNERGRDVEPQHCSKRQSFDVSPRSNTA